MKKAIAALAALSIATAAFAVAPPLRSQSSFAPGESLQYSVQYSLASVNTPVASASMTLSQEPYGGQSAYHAKVYAQTAKFFDVFFPIREDFQSWFTPGGTLPLKATRNTSEGKYTVYNGMTFDYSTSTVMCDVKKKSGQRNTPVSLQGPTFDLTTLLYYVRNLDFDRMQQGAQYTVSFLIDDKLYNLALVWGGREVKKIKGIGNVNALKLTATSLSNLDIQTSESSGLVLSFYLADDDSRVVLYFDAPISVGRVAGTLKSYSGLKYPFSAVQQ